MKTAFFAVVVVVTLGYAMAVQVSKAIDKATSARRTAILEVLK